MHLPRSASLPLKLVHQPVDLIRTILGSVVSAAMIIQCCWRQFRLRIRVQTRLLLKKEKLQFEEMLERFGDRFREAFEQFEITRNEELDSQMRFASGRLRDVLEDANREIIKAKSGDYEYENESKDRPAWRVLYQQAECYIGLEDACKSGRVELIINALHSYSENIRQDNTLPAAIGKVGTRAVISLLEHVESVMLPKAIENSLEEGSISTMLNDHRHHRYSRIRG